PAPGNLLKDHSERGGIDIRAAVFFGDIQSEQAYFLHLADQLVRIFIAVLELRSNRHDFLFYEPTNRTDDQVPFGACGLHATPPLGRTIWRSSVNTISCR